MNENEDLLMAKIAFFAGGYIIFSLYEWIGSMQFHKWLFFIGPRTLALKENWGITKFNITQEFIETASGKFFAVDEKTALFRDNYPLSGRVIGPLPLNGVIELKEGIAKISGRIPLAPTIFICLWFAGLAFGVVSMILQGGIWSSLFIIILGAIGIKVFANSYLVEKKRFLMVLEEIKATLKGSKISNEIFIQKRKNFEIKESNKFRGRTK